MRRSKRIVENETPTPSVGWNGKGGTRVRMLSPRRRGGERKKAAANIQVVVDEINTDVCRGTGTERAVACATTTWATFDSHRESTRIVFL